MNAFVRLNRRPEQSGYSPASRFACAAPSDVEQLIANFFQPLASDATLDAIKLDVRENATAYLVAASIPGVDRADLEVAVDQNKVSIRAESRAQAPVEGERTLHTERFAGKTARSFTLPQEINDAAVEAKYIDGVLHLVLPKKVTAQAKKINIA